MNTHELSECIQIHENKNGLDLHKPIHVRVLERNFEHDGIYVKDGVQVIVDGEPVDFNVVGNKIVFPDDVQLEGTIDVSYRADGWAFSPLANTNKDQPIKIGGIKADKNRRKAAKQARKKNRK